jgi:bis(5'-nucleosidyl)-tetraphosphatase
VKQEFSAGVVVFHREGGKHHYLLLCYPHGHWDFAKGHIEDGETKVTAALREVAEETKLAVTLIEGFEHTMDYFFKEGELLIKKRVYFFLGQSLTTAVSLSAEHTAYAWLSYEEAFAQVTFKNAQVLLQDAERFLSEHVFHKKQKNRQKSR